MRHYEDWLVMGSLLAELVIGKAKRLYEADKDQATFDLEAWEPVELSITWTRWD